MCLIDTPRLLRSETGQYRVKCDLCRPGHNLPRRAPRSSRPSSLSLTGTGGGGVGEGLVDVSPDINAVVIQRRYHCLRRPRLITRLKGHHEHPCTSTRADKRETLFEHSRGRRDREHHERNAKTPQPINLHVCVLLSLDSNSALLSEHHSDGETDVLWARATGIQVGGCAQPLGGCHRLCNWFWLTSSKAVRPL